MTNEAADCPPPHDGLIETYRKAGEVFYELSKALPCGKLTMVESFAPGVVAYEWTFRHGGDRYGIEKVITDHEFSFTRDLSMLVATIAREFIADMENATRQKKPTSAAT